MSQSQFVMDTVSVTLQDGVRHDDDTKFQEESLMRAEIYFTGNVRGK